MIYTWERKDILAGMYVYTSNGILNKVGYLSKPNESGNYYHLICMTDGWTTQFEDKEALAKHFTENGYTPAKPNELKASFEQPSINRIYEQ